MKAIGEAQEVSPTGSSAANFTLVKDPEREFRGERLVVVGDAEGLLIKYVLVGASCQSPSGWAGDSPLSLGVPLRSMRFPLNTCPPELDICVGIANPTHQARRAHFLWLDASEPIEESLTERQVRTAMTPGEWEALEAALREQASHYERVATAIRTQAWGALAGQMKPVKKRLTFVAATIEALRRRA